VETVEGAWLFKALAVVLAVAILCTYLAICILFYRGQWQLVLHPARTSNKAAAQEHLIRFAPGESAQPQLTGEWLPATANNRYGGLTVLFLAGGDGTRANSTDIQVALRKIGLNVFTFDYRGYGQSADIHPSQQSMTEDSEAVWNYLTSTRGIPGAAILPYGVGVGASLAAKLTSNHPEIPAVILDSPYTDLREVIRRDARMRLLPTGLLFHEEFPLKGPLARLQKPKLLISTVQGPESAAFLTASDPKIMVTLPGRTEGQFDGAVIRFLDQYLTLPPVAPSGTKAN